MIETDKNPRNLPVPLKDEHPREHRRQASRISGTTATYEAQIIGQPGRKRGLRGGEEVLKQARSSYLETEYSGPADRRPPKGRLRQTEI